MIERIRFLSQREGVMRDWKRVGVRYVNIRETFKIKFLRQMIIQCCRIYSIIMQRVDFRSVLENG